MRPDEVMGSTAGCQGVEDAHGLVMMGGHMHEGKGAARKTSKNIM